jgi:hypothetical protein
LVEWRLAREPKYLERTCPAPLSPPQIPPDQTQVRTRDAAVGNQGLTAWAMARLNYNLFKINLLWSWSVKTYCFYGDHKRKIIIKLMTLLTFEITEFCAQLLLTLFDPIYKRSFVYLTFDSPLSTLSVFRRYSDKWQNNWLIMHLIEFYTKLRYYPEIFFQWLRKTVGNLRRAGVPPEIRT